MQLLHPTHVPSNIAIQTTRHAIHDPEFWHEYRASDTDFTRRRRLTFMNVVVYLLQKTARSIQQHLNDFFQELTPGFPSVTPASWSEARLKLRHTAFVELNERAILNTVYGGESGFAVRRWNGLRLLGIDSSLIRLPNRPALGQEFGWVECSNQAGSAGRHPQGRLSVLTDLLNRIALHTLFVPWQHGERDLAVEHLDEMKADDLAILDRGFASYELFARFVAQQRLFVCRCPTSSFSTVEQLFQQNQAGCSVVVTLRPSGKKRAHVRQAGLPEEITVRLVAVRLDTGELEVLATNLMDESLYPTCEFKELYHYRWGIEKYYGLLKGRLDLEHFTGLSAEAVRQDVYSTVFLSNLESILIQDSAAQLQQKSQSLQHPQQVNHAVSFHTIKSHIIDLLLGSAPVQDVLLRLRQLFLNNPVSKRPERKVPRSKPSAWRSYQYQRNIRKVVF
jgi:hypothetical protein